MIELDKEAMPQKTNLDALRGMSVEETAQIIGNPCKFCYHDDEDCASCRISVDDNDIVEVCNKANIPVFMKNSLVPIMGEENMRREFPDGLKKAVPDA